VNQHLRIACNPLFAVLAFFSAHAEPLQLHGEFSAHDPSTIVKDKDDYWVFATGWGIRSRHSKDLVQWESGPAMFTNPPAWTTKAVPGFRGFFWAPDIIHLGDEYFAYYSASTWGSRTSVIGLATSPTLDPADPRYKWIDRGPVIQSGHDSDFNTIDPSVTLDREGKLWLAFGSYWSGIKLVELDPKTGLRIATNSPIHVLAWKKEIEAACLYPHGNFYYLFVNWGLCCRGTDSTYNIRVGRSPTITGPYVDKTGSNMLSGGGTLFLGTEGRFIGPGHAGFLTANGTNWLSFHYYDGKNFGAKTLGIRAVNWDADGWPRPD